MVSKIKVLQKFDYGTEGWQYYISLVKDKKVYEGLVSGDSKGQVEIDFDNDIEIDDDESEKIVETLLNPKKAKKKKK